MTLDSKIELLMAIRKPRKERARGRSPMMRRNVMRRAGYKCEVCAYSILDILHVHHIRPVHAGGESEILNLILICPNCHALAHLCSRILQRGMDSNSLALALAESGVPHEHAPKLILIGTERAIVTYSGEIVERPADKVALEELILRDMKSTPETANAGDQL